MFVERKRGDCLRNRRDFDALHQAGVAGCGRRRRRRRRSQYDVLVYDALERTHEYDVHDASNRANNCLDSVDDDVTKAVFNNESVYAVHKTLHLTHLCDV